MTIFTTKVIAAMRGTGCAEKANLKDVSMQRALFFCHSELDSESRFTLLVAWRS